MGRFRPWEFISRTEIHIDIEAIRLTVKVLNVFVIINLIFKYNALCWPDPGLSLGIGLGRWF
jgi:hypothetical protein